MDPNVLNNTTGEAIDVSNYGTYFTNKIITSNVTTSNVYDGSTMEPILDISSYSAVNLHIYQDGDATDIGYMRSIASNIILGDNETNLKDYIYSFLDETVLYTLTISGTGHPGVKITLNNIVFQRNGSTPFTIDPFTYDIVFKIYEYDGESPTNPIATPIETGGNTSIDGAVVSSDSLTTTLTFDNLTPGKFYSIYADITNNVTNTVVNNIGVAFNIPTIPVKSIYTLNIVTPRKVTVDSEDVVGLTLKHTWTVSPSITFDQSGKYIIMNNSEDSQISVTCEIQYMSSGTVVFTIPSSVVTFADGTNSFNNNFTYSGSLSIDPNHARVIASQNSGSNPVQWSWTINNKSNNSSVVTYSWATNSFRDIPDYYRDSSLYYMKVWGREESGYGFTKEVYIGAINFPSALVTITNVTSIGNRAYFIHVNSYHTVIDASISGASRYQGELLKYQFNENETGGTKLCSVTVQDSRGFTGSAIYNFNLSVVFDTYYPTIEFVQGETRIVEIKYNTYTDEKLESDFDYVWSASSGITLDSSQVDREFKNYVAGYPAGGGYVYVDVTQTNSLGFKAHKVSFMIGIPLPTSISGGTFTIIDDNTFSDTIPSSTQYIDTGERRIKNSSGNIVGVYSIEDTYTLEANVSKYGFNNWLFVNSVTLNKPIIDMVNTIVRNTSIVLHWTSEPSEDLSSSTFFITYESSTTSNTVQAFYPSHTITGLNEGTNYTVSVLKNYNSGTWTRTSDNVTITTSYFDTTADYSATGNIKLTLYLENGAAVYQHVFNHVLFDESQSAYSYYSNRRAFMGASHERPVFPTGTRSGGYTGPISYDYNDYIIKLPDILQGEWVNGGYNGLTSKGLTLEDIHSYTLVSTNHCIQPYMGVTTINESLRILDNSISLYVSELLPPTNTVTSIQSILPMITTGLANHPTVSGYDGYDYLYIYVKQRCITVFPDYTTTPTELYSGIIWIHPYESLDYGKTKPNAIHSGTNGVRAYDTGWFTSVEHSADSPDYNYFKYTNFRGTVEDSDLWNSTIVANTIAWNTDIPTNSISIGPMNNIRALYWDDYKELGTWNTTNPDEFEVKEIQYSGSYYNRKTITIPNMNLPNSYV